MSRIKNWLRNQVAAISIAVSSVEKNVLGQERAQLTEPTKQERRYTQGTLADSLVHGEVTQEVKNLRWRMYKIMRAAKDLEVNLTPIDVDADGDKYYKINKRKSKLHKVKLDPADDYPLEMIVDNTPITTDATEGMALVKETYETAKKNYDEKGELISASHGEIDGESYLALNKRDHPIMVVRDFLPRFEIEKYTKKLNIRTISETEKLLEFYVSKYPEEDNRNSNVFLKEIQKVITNGPLNINFLEIKEIGFITLNTAGADDYLSFAYDIISFDKIVEFNGHYVIKFKANVTVNGEDMLKDYVEADLEKKYENKEKK